MSTITVNAASSPVKTTLNPTDQFIFDQGVLDITSGLPAYYGTSVTDWYYDGAQVHLDGRGGQVGLISLVDQSPAGIGQHLQLASLGSDLYLTESGQGEPSGATLIRAGSVADPIGEPQPPVTQPEPQQPPPQIIAVHDNTTGADLPDTSSAYTGPVAGVASQYINVTPDNLNIMAKADSLFIKTDGGNDAVALHGGTNVVDAGTGSNFLTAAGGFDTFFLDCRNIAATQSAAGPVPGAIWDTIQSLGSGDAATLWGIGPGTALAWQKNQGAVGHTGLTLHANLPNGSEASLTLAGIDNKAAVSLSYGSTGGSSYLYVKAV